MERVVTFFSFERVVCAMKVILNGKETDINDHMTIGSLLQSKGINPLMIVVEHNDQIPERKKWGSIVLKDNDHIEVIKIMGGG